MSAPANRSAEPSGGGRGPGAARIVRLTPEHAAAYRALMLNAYEKHPRAFTALVSERESKPLDWWRARLSAEPDAATLVLGALCDGELVGTVGLSVSPRAKLKHRALVFGMYVLADRRGAGLGRRLLGALIEAARERGGLKVLQLTVTEGNRAARDLYERAGFEVFGVEPYALAVEDGYASKVHMWRELP